MQKDILPFPRISLFSSEVDILNSQSNLSLEGSPPSVRKIMMPVHKIDVGERVCVHRCVLYVYLKVFVLICTCVRICGVEVDNRLAGEYFSSGGIHGLKSSYRLWCLFPSSSDESIFTIILAVAQSPSITTSTSSVIARIVHLQQGGWDSMCPQFEDKRKCKSLSSLSKQHEGALEQSLDTQLLCGYWQTIVVILNIIDV